MQGSPSSLAPALRSIDQGGRAEGSAPIRLADFILANIDPIMADWEAFARRVWPVDDGHGGVGVPADAAELRDHAVEILLALAADMNAAQSATEAADKSKGLGPAGGGAASVDGVALIHGAGRGDSGFALPAVIAEYRALRASVLRLWRLDAVRFGRVADTLDLADITRFNESIDQSLASAVEGFTREARRVAAELSRSEASFQSLAESISQLAWTADAAGTVHWCNRRYLDYTGTRPEDVAARGWLGAVDAEALPGARAAWEVSVGTGVPFDTILPLRGADGATRPFLTRALPVRDTPGSGGTPSGGPRWVGTHTDVSEQQELETELRRYRAGLERLVSERTIELRRAESELRRAERVGSMGALALGIGHDLSNLMLPMSMRLSSLSAQDLPPGAREDAEAIAGSLSYLRTLAAGLRQMAADPDAPPPRDGVDLAAWWPEALGAVRGVLPRGVGLESDVPSGLPPVRAARGGLTQAVFNLVQNASEALSKAPGGTVRITACLAPADDRCCPGGVRLMVADDGPGMSPDIAARCFEPYFSTKGRAVSTGLGLAMVRGFAEQAGGMVEVESTPGKGTVFTLHLPAVATPASAAAAPARPALPVSRPTLHNGASAVPADRR